MIYLLLEQNQTLTPIKKINLHIYQDKFLNQTTALQF